MLKKNPSRALREAELAPVVILKGHEPNAVLLHLDASLTEAEQGLRPALAAGLFRDGLLSLGAGSKMSGLALTDFVRHLGALGGKRGQGKAGKQQEKGPGSIKFCSAPRI